MIKLAYWKENISINWIQAKLAKLFLNYLKLNSLFLWDL